MPRLLRLLALVAVVAVALSWASAAAPRTATVTFVLTNDIDTMGERPMPDGRTRGGFARLAAVIAAERAKGGHVVFTHGGDTLSPSLMSALDRGAHIVAVTNAIAPDVFVPGNHEFDFGPDVFRQRMAEARFPRYAANLRGADGNPLPGFRDRAVLDIGGVRIGVTGATYDRTPQVSSPGDLRFLPTVETVRRQAEALRSEGADLVVAVMHAERAQARELAATRAVDLILTGHSHDLLLHYDGRTVTAESSHNAIQVVAIDVTLEITEIEGRRDVRWWPRFRVIDSADVTPDPQIAAKIASLEASLADELGVPIGTAAVELDTRAATVRLREAAFGNLVADAMLAATNADIAIMNGGGIRAGRVYPPGHTLTRRDILSELPFGNRIGVLAVSGSDLRASLENALARLPVPRGGFPHVAGLAMEIDASRPPGRRILSIRTDDGPLDDDRTYKVATNEYLARGRNGYEAFGRIRRLLAPEDGPLLANAVMAHIRRLGTVKTGVEGRIRQK